MKPTDLGGSDHVQRVVDCQWACPAHTPVPEYIRMVAAGRHTDAYMLNWHANVFPGILGRVCDRPCEPACRRTRVEDGESREPIAVCRLKRVAADHKDPVERLLPGVLPKNGKRVACVGAGPASLTVARDLALQGYDVTIFDGEKKAGGFMRSQIPRFRLPADTLDEEIGYILNLGVNFRAGERIESLKALTQEGYDAIFVGCGAPRGREMQIPGREEASDQIHIGIEWLAAVSFGHIERIGKRVIVLGGGNTAMDCCRTARRLGGEQVHVIVRSGYEEMKSSTWERADAKHEGITISNYMVPKEFTHDEGKLTGVLFEHVSAQYDERGRRSLIPTGEPDTHVPCDEVLIAVGQENAFPWIERDIGLDFDKWDMPVVDPLTLQSTLPFIFFGGDAAFGPKNIITAVAHGHEAAISIDKLCHGEDVRERPAPEVTVVNQRMGIHEWSYDNAISLARRHAVPMLPLEETLKDIKAEVELGFEQSMAVREALRCLNCDIQPVFTAKNCIECDACTDICPMDSITFTADGDEAALRERLKAPTLHPAEPLYVSSELKTGRVMVRDEDLCLHCGLCAERCPSGALDMQKFLIKPAQAGPACRAHSAALPASPGCA